jgi:hypothetical protein
VADDRQPRAQLGRGPPERRDRQARDVPARQVGPSELAQPRARAAGVFRVVAREVTQVELDRQRHRAVRIAAIEFGDDPLDVRRQQPVERELTEAHRARLVARRLLAAHVVEDAVVLPIGDAPGHHVAGQHRIADQQPRAGLRGGVGQDLARVRGRQRRRGVGFDVAEGQRQHPIDEHDQQGQRRQQRPRAREPGPAVGDPPVDPGCCAILSGHLGAPLSFKIGSK